MLKKLSCRVFTCSDKIYKNGGNPLTVFLWDQNQFSKEKCEILAKSVDFESVIVKYDSRKRQDEQLLPPQFFFYMPSGEEVSFCAHAALGGCVGLAQSTPEESSIRDNSVKMLFQRGFDNETTSVKVYDRKEAELIFEDQTSSLEEYNLLDTLVDNKHRMKSIEKILEQLNLSIDEDIDFNEVLPPFLNSSVARTKTLIPLKRDRLGKCRNPPDAVFFRELNDEIESTGIYLYSRDTNDSATFECRQYPRFSGYSEDPATGIAAAALASSLHKEYKRRDDKYHLTNYTFYQGTHMGRRSMIKIRFEETIDENDEKLKKERLSCSGLVDIDSIEYLNSID